MVGGKIGIAGIGIKTKPKSREISTWEIKPATIIGGIHAK
jgi:hypothetical protein